MTELDIINEKQITIEVSGDVITVNVLRYEVSNGAIIYDLGELTEIADITINCINIDQVQANIQDMARVATTLTLENFGKILNIAMTKLNGDLDLVFTLAGAGVVFDVFDAANNVFTRATTITISGDDANKSWALIFDRTQIPSGANAIIQVTASITAFA